MQLAKKVDALPLTRDYSFDKERELRKVEAPAVATNPVRPSFGTALSLHPQEARRPSQRIKNKALED
jgi:hypothetical protein